LLHLGSEHTRVDDKRSYSQVLKSEGSNSSKEENDSAAASIFEKLSINGNGEKTPIPPPPPPPPPFPNAPPAPPPPNSKNQIFSPQDDFKTEEERIKCECKKLFFRPQLKEMPLLTEPLRFGQIVLNSNMKRNIKAYNSNS
jgi:hypothetical protein